MADLRTLIIEHPVAQRLADLTGVMNDLDLATRACDLFLASPTTGSDEATLRSKAIASFAILTYFRTLTNGVRTGISAERIARLSQGLQATHQRLKNVRDQYLAHSINNQEENVIEVTLKEDGSSIETLSTSHTRVGNFASWDVSSLKTLVEGVTEIVNGEYESEFEKVWDFIESLSEDQRRKILHPPRLSVVHSDWQGKRRRFRG